jgi:pyruvate kinase
MLDAGMDVARFNMSHGSYEQHADAVRHLRELAKERERPLALLQDLSGPKLRLGELPEPLELREGDHLRLGDQPGISGVVPVNLEGFARHLSTGDRLSLADGLFQLKVRSISEGIIDTEILEGRGVLTSHKGVNLPHASGEVAIPTAKDRRDLEFGLQEDFDWIALSFVRSARDADEIRRLMNTAGKPRPLLAKIEKPEAVDRIAEIIEVFDGLMVARGDLGVETSIERVPGIQKRLIRHANRAAKPVITATQMLLSMVSSARPTRAEVADVTAAVLDGSDAVMVSEETAQGQFPVEVVRTLASICAEAESLREERPDITGLPEQSVSPSEGIGRTVPHLARLIAAKLIVVPTATGRTARRVAAMKPGIPILALSAHPQSLRTLALTGGVMPRKVEEVGDTESLFAASRRAAVSTGLVSPGDRIVITAGSFADVPGSTDIVKVEVI